MALTKEVLELLLNQQKEFMEEQRKLREKELNDQKEERLQGMKELKELISKSNEEVKEKVENLDVKHTKAFESVTKELDEARARQEKADEDRAALEIRMRTMEENLEVRKSKDIETRPTYSEVAAVNPRGADNSETSSAIREILKQANKVIGLAPINAGDIRRQGQEHSVEDEDSMMLLAVKEYLRYELKIQKTEIEKLLISKVWKQNKDNFDILYVKFEEESSVNLCYRHSPRMRKDEDDVRLVRYTPPQLLDRKDRLRDAEYQLRNGDIKYKTRIRNGVTDLILEKKTKAERSWTKVNVENLPPVDFSRTSSQPSISRSPAEGRKRNSKRTRSTPSPPAKERKAAKVDDEHDEVSDESKTPTKPWDVSMFTVDNVRSPALMKTKSKSLEQEFLFSPDKTKSSGIPMMKQAALIRKKQTK